MTNGECPIIAVHIENGYGIAFLKECMTNQPFKRWKDGCRVTYECLQEYVLEGNQNVICKAHILKTRRIISIGMFMSTRNFNLKIIV